MTFVHLLAALFASMLAFAANARAADDRPNIVFIMSDDHAYQAISAYGSDISKLAPTPNIDRIASGGAIFLNSYVTNSLCGPSRATMLTGLYSHAHGFMRNGHSFDNRQWVWPRALAQAGYQTALFGKWHLNRSPDGIGLDAWKVLDDQGEYYNPDFITAAGMTRVEGYATDLITAESLDWLRNRRDPAKPFALLIQHKAPHRNFMPALRHVTKYAGTTFPVPENFFDDYAGRPAAAAQEMQIARDMHEGHDLKMTAAVGSSQLRHDPWPQAFGRLTPAQRREWDRLHQADNDAMNAARLTGRDLAIWKYQRFSANTSAPSRPSTKASARCSTISIPAASRPTRSSSTPATRASTSASMAGSTSASFTRSRCARPCLSGIRVASRVAPVSLPRCRTPTWRRPSSTLPG